MLTFCEKIVFPHKAKEMNFKISLDYIFPKENKMHSIIIHSGITEVKPKLYFISWKVISLILLLLTA